MEKKTPYEAVIEEMSLHSSLDRDQLDVALMGLINFLQDRAFDSLKSKGGDSPESLEHAHQFLAFSEMLNFYGSALIAFDEIEEENLPN